MKRVFLVFERGIANEETFLAARSTFEKAVSLAVHHKPAVVVDAPLNPKPDTNATLYRTELS